MTELNIIINKHCAIVNGKETFLTGCDASSCPKYCMRKDTRLISREIYNPSACRYYIPVDLDGNTLEATEINAVVSGKFHDLPIFHHFETIQELLLRDELRLKDVVVLGDTFTANAKSVLACFIEDYDMLQWSNVRLASIN